MMFSYKKNINILAADFCTAELCASDLCAKTYVFLSFSYANSVFCMCLVCSMFFVDFNKIFYQKRGSRLMCM